MATRVSTVKGWIEKGRLDLVRAADPAVFQKFDPLYTVAQCGGPRAPEILAFLTKERGLKSDIALRRALQCQNYEVAEVLYDGGACAVPENCIYSLEAMKWAAERGGAFDEEAVFEILQVWNGEDADERLAYLFERCPRLPAACSELLAEHAAEKAEEARRAALPFECANCREPCEKKGECGCCEEALCEECGAPGPRIHKADWLCDEPNVCEQCGDVVCDECMLICFECASAGEHTNLCADCSPGLRLAKCEYHEWPYCEAHEGVSCGTCHANQNFAAKMG